MGHTPSIMDYSRFNYVAQPEDNIDVADLIPAHRSVRCLGHEVGLQADSATPATPDDEKPTLDQWAREQDKTPWYRFSTAGAAGSDPGELTEAVGDADALEIHRAGHEEPAARGQNAACRQPPPKRASPTRILPSCMAACWASGRSR